LFKLIRLCKTHENITMKRLFANLSFLAIALIAAVAMAGETPLVRMATTTSTENSGLFTVIQPAFEKALDIRVHVIAVGTGKALELGRRGDVDVVLVHAKPAEEAFVKAGYGLARQEIMYNDFVIVGPPADPAGVRGLQDAGKAFAKIAGSTGIFVSRGDESGTHKKEHAIWQQASIQPEGAWYRQVGQGMGKTLQIAGELNAYTLVDRGTWLAYRANSPLELLVSGGDELKNPYGIIAVSPVRFPDVNHEAVQRLIDWFATAEARALIAGYKVDGEALFYPVAR
jgi:tungstate transport system substrate-binding protein